jgi:hypothetical protein
MIIAGGRCGWGCAYKNIVQSDLEKYFKTDSKKDKNPMLIRGVFCFGERQKVYVSIIVKHIEKIYSAC